MGRPKRDSRAGIVYHVLNRANARMTIFEKDGDYEAFERVLTEAVERSKIQLLSYCVMPNHWHLVVCPTQDGQLSTFTGWLTLTHTQRWHAHRHSTGTGHIYQGRFKSFPCQDNEYFLTLCRYVERNPLKANLVERAEQWRWSSLYRWHSGTAKEKKILSTWPVARKRKWLDFVNETISKNDQSQLDQSVKRGSPFGDSEWTASIVDQLGLESTIKPIGRPKKRKNGS